MNSSYSTRQQQSHDDDDEASHSSRRHPPSRLLLRGCGVPRGEGGGGGGGGKDARPIRQKFRLQALRLLGAMSVRERAVRKEEEEEEEKGDVVWSPTNVFLLSHSYPPVPPPLFPKVPVQTPEEPD